ncbi:cytosolic Fe-S cluster assembly factor NBP35, partial [Tanacetum coccineum]
MLFSPPYVGVFPELSGEKFNTFLALAEKLRSDYEFAHTLDAKLLPRGDTSVSGPLVRLFKPFDELVVDFEDFDLAALEKFIEEATIPTLTFFNHDPKHHPFVIKYFSTPNVKAMLFVNFTSKSFGDFESKYHDIANEHKGTGIRFLIADVETSKGAFEEAKVVATLLKSKSILFALISYIFYEVIWGKENVHPETCYSQVSVFLNHDQWVESRSSLRLLGPVSDGIALACSTISQQPPQLMPNGFKQFPCVASLLLEHGWKYSTCAYRLELLLVIGGLVRDSLGWRFAFFGKATLMLPFAILGFTVKSKTKKEYMVNGFGSKKGRRMKGGDLIEIAERMATVKHKILILSGKGGVSKSTFSAQLSFALAAMDHEVGLLDIDICGPSIPKMLGLEGQEVHVNNLGWSPVYVDSIGVMSIGFMLHDPDDAVIWRGARKADHIKKFVKNVYWGELDFLIVDAPPGTSDEQIEISQLLKKRGIDGAIIKVGIQVLGIVENMSGLSQPLSDIKYMKRSMNGEEPEDVTKRALKIMKEKAPELLDYIACTEVFDSSGGGAAGMCAEMGVPFLGKVPLDPKLRKAGEEGKSCFMGDDCGVSASALSVIINK